MKPNPPIYRRRKINGKYVRLERVGKLWLLPNGMIAGRVQDEKRKVKR